MKKVLIASGIAVLAFAMVAGAQAYTFSSNLTVGSTGADVVALQTWLVNNHYLTMPSGVAMGYFGARTKTAVAAYQVQAGIANPGTGFVGPLTRKALNAGGTVANPPVTTTTGCPAGYTCTINTTNTPVIGGTTGGITTPGIPGIMTVTSGPLSSSVIHVGDQNVPIQSIRVQAQYSDLDVQSLTLNVGNNTAFYNKLFNTISVTDGTNVLASQAVNGSTVVQSGSEYLLGIAGFHFIVPKGTYKDIIIKGTLNPSVDTTYITAGQSHYPGNTASANSINGTALNGWGIGVVANGVRGVDGAGLNLYGPTTAMNQSVTINAATTDNAQANISLDAASPLVASVPVTDTTNGQYLGLPVLVFDVNAQNDTLHLRTVNVGVTYSGTGSIGAAYLFQGSTQIASANIVGGVASFSNISNGTSGATIPVNTTVPFTVKVDVTGVTSGTTLTINASTTASQTILSSNDSTATLSGAATANAQTVSGSGPLFTLSGTPTITKSVLSTDQSGNATTSYSATFNVQVTAVGQNINLPLAASTTGASFYVGAKNAWATTSLAIYKNGAIDYSSTNIANGLSNYDTTASVTASYSQPTNTTISSNGLYFTLAQNQTVTIPVTFTWLVKNPGANTYAAQLQSINWLTSALSANSATFMAAQTAWRTNSI